MLLQELKRPGEELFGEYSMDEMAFVPAVKPPPSRTGTSAKRGKASPTNINFDLGRISCPESMDFFTSLKPS
jgi:hypothetical protein